jgi:gentisate 1,2-dioxygenase
VFEGSGYSVVNGMQYDWQQGDFFVIPSWAWHEHRNTSKSERALLFSIQDTPVMTALGMYREEPYTDHGGHQPVTGLFTARDTIAAR